MTASAAGRSPGWIGDDSTFGARLAIVRQRMGWGNVKEAAMACGIPVENWRRWERDGVAPRDVVDQAERISERTGCDFYWLLAGTRRGTVAGPAGGAARLTCPEVPELARRPVALRRSMAA